MTDSISYDMIVLGGGSGGIVAATASASLGARTLLVEKTGRLGGECSWTGCVPSKALIHLARSAHELRHYGAAAAADEVSATALQQTRATTARIHKESDSKGMLEGLGAEVVFATPRIAGEHRVEIDGKLVTARRLVLTTGSSPVTPDIPGLAEAGFVDNTTMFDLQSPPATLAVIGGGPMPRLSVSDAVEIFETK